MKFLNPKNVLVSLVILTVVVFSISDASRGVLFLGRFHPLILHLPIGALILTLFIDIVGRLNRNYPKQVVQYALAFSAFFAVLACILGYFLSFEGGYDSNTLNIHLWVGIASAILITFLFLFSRSDDKKVKKIFLPFFILTLVSISVAGHYGSVLTHGSDFLTHYAKSPERAKVIEHIDSLKIYDDVVFKILDAKCIQCHNTTKRKGELSLNSPEDILKGGENGIVIEKGNAAESALVKSILLPLSDEKHMPPEGKPQLTKEDIWLIEYWINNNADFKEKAVNLQKNDTLQRLLKKYLVFDEVEIKQASLKEINTVKEAGFSVLKLVPGEPELRVKFVKGDLTKEALKKLEKLRTQTVELDLSGTALSDEMLTDLKPFKNLKKLILSNTNIADASLKQFQKSKSLKVLNLYNTKISDEGLNRLFEHVVPEQVFAWETKVGDSALVALQNKYAARILKGTDKGFVEISHLDMPNFTSDKNLFVDTISVSLKSKIKNVDIYFTVDGSNPDSTSLKYDDKIFLDKAVTLKAISYKKGWLPSPILEKNFVSVKHEIAKYDFTKQPDEKYPGAHKLFDLKEGSTNLRDGNWVGFLGDNVETMVDLESVKQVSKISVNCLEDVAQWVMYPKKIEVYSSKDNSQFKKIGSLNIRRKGKYGDGSEIKTYTVDIPETKTQFLKVVVQNYKTLPSWHEGAGNDSWLFVDEILVR